MQRIIASFIYVCSIKLVDIYTNECLQEIFKCE